MNDAVHCYGNLLGGITLSQQWNCSIRFKLFSSLYPLTFIGKQFELTFSSSIAREVMFTTEILCAIT